MNNKFIITNDNDLHISIKKWFSQITLKETNVVYIELRLIDGLKLERISANGLNNMLIAICALREHNPNIKIFVQLLSNDLIEGIEKNKLPDKIRENIKRLLVFIESLNLVDMLIKLDVIVRPSNEVLQNIIVKLGAWKKERSHAYSTKILSLSPLISNSQEQYNLTYRMKTLINILYWQLRNRVDIKEVEEASGQIMFELVKNIYQHANIKNDIDINGFTCAQINSTPLIKLKDLKKEESYTESAFLALSQLESCKMYLNKKNLGSFISITVNDFGIGIHKKVKASLKNKELDIENAIIEAFTTTFSSKSSENEEEYWQIDSEMPGIKLEHKGYGLIYCLMFVYKNLGRIKICSGNMELKLFTKIDAWSENIICYTPVDFLALIEEKPNKYLHFFEMETERIEDGEFIGTQILIEIPTDYVYKGMKERYEK